MHDRLVYARGMRLFECRSSFQLSKLHKPCSVTRLHLDGCVKYVAMILEMNYDLKPGTANDLTCMSSANESTVSDSNRSLACI